MKPALPLIFLLAACTASGPAYNETEVKENLIIYRPSHIVASARPYRITVNNQPECKLGNGGFYALNINGKAEISAAAPDMPGTTRITIATPSFVRVEANSGKFLATGFGGLAGMGAAEAVSSSSGPYHLTTVAPEQAKSELKGLNRDCMPGSN